MTNQNHQWPAFIFVKLGLKHVKIVISDISYLETKGNYVIIATPKKKYMLHETLKQMEDILPSEIFIRIHRRYIISLLHTSEFDFRTAKVGQKEFPIGKNHYGILDRRTSIRPEPSPKVKY